MDWCAFVLLSLLKLSYQQSDVDTETVIVNKFKEACIQESGVDQSILADPTAFESDKNAKCFVKCVMEKSGVIDKKGDLQTETIAEVFQLSDDDPYAAAIKKCQEIKLDDPCELAFAKHKCVMETG